MKTFYTMGAMYIELEGEEIIRESVDLGDGILKPGQFVSKLGEKKRSMFEMNDGYYLKYEGHVVPTDGSKELLFSTNCIDDKKRPDMYYAFCFIDKETLLICNPHNGSGSDIKIKHLETYDSVELIDLRIGKQISLIEGIYEQ